MSRCARQSGSGVVGSLHVLENTGPWHHHPPCFNSPEALWMFSECLNSSWSFTKRGFWLNHWPVGTVPSLSALSSHQRYRKNKPLITPPRIFLNTFLIERFSRPCLWLVFTPVRDSILPKTEKKFQRILHLGIKTTLPWHLALWGFVP